MKLKTLFHENRIEIAKNVEQRIFIAFLSQLQSHRSRQHICDFPFQLVAVQMAMPDGNAASKTSYCLLHHIILCSLSIRRTRVKCKQKNIHTWARCTNERIRSTRTGMFCVNIIEPATSVCILTSIFLPLPCARTHFSYGKRASPSFATQFVCNVC